MAKKKEVFGNVNIVACSAFSAATWLHCELVSWMSLMGSIKTFAEVDLAQTKAKASQIAGIVMRVKFQSAFEREK